MKSTFSLVGSRGAVGAHKRSLVIYLAEVSRGTAMPTLGGGIKSQVRPLTARLLLCPFSKGWPLRQRHCMFLQGLATLFLLAAPVAAGFVLVLG